LRGGKSHFLTRHLSFSLSRISLASPPAKDPKELFAFLSHAETGSMVVMSLIVLERGEIVFYNGIDITVDLEVLHFWGR
jgi:hypothetical protein